MSPHTAKAIKDIIAAMKNYYSSTEGSVSSCWPAEEKLERALHDFAENIRQDAIEP